MTGAKNRSLLHDDEGMSLSEVIVYLVVSTLVMIGLGTMFASALSAHATTEARDTATGRLELALSSLQSSIRNSTAFSTDGSHLRARVATGNGTGWECRAWALTDDALFYKAASTAIAIPSTTAGFWTSGWTDLTGLIGAADDDWSDRVSLTGTLTDPYTSATVAFVRSTNGDLQYGIDMTVGATAKVRINGGAVPQAAGAGSPTACW